MALPLGQFDPASLIVTFGGVVMQGYASGSFVNVERNEDAWREYKGEGGDIARARVRDKSGTVSVTLIATSPTNALLSALAKKDEKTGDAVGALIVRDVLGTTLVSGSSAWIKKTPPITYSGEIETREWVFFVADLDVNQ